MSLSANTVAVAQGTFWTATGIWPIVHFKSFTAVTGPKKEPWLVKTLGALISVVGGTLLYAGFKRSVSAPVRLLAVGSAAALAAVDLWYAGKGRISPMYFADAAVEAALFGGWLAAREGPRCVQTASAEDDRPAPLGGCFDIARGETRRSDGSRDVVLEGSMESFPASDPPSYMG